MKKDLAVALAHPGGEQPPVEEWSAIADTFGGRVLLLSVLAGHQRYAHITALRCDPVNPPLLGMRKVVSEDAVRRGLAKIDETAGMD